MRVEEPVSQVNICAKKIIQKKVSTNPPSRTDPEGETWPGKLRSICPCSSSGQCQL